MIKLTEIVKEKKLKIKEKYFKILIEKKKNILKFFISY